MPQPKFYQNLTEVLAHEPIVREAWERSGHDLATTLVVLANAFQHLRAQLGVIAAELPAAHRLGLSPDRCGQCENCKIVQRAAQSCLPNPPFSHASDHTVQVWNDMLAAHPCLRPGERTSA